MGHFLRASPALGLTELTVWHFKGKPGFAGSRNEAFLRLASANYFYGQAEVRCVR